jgi:hypothetical protein
MGGIGSDLSDMDDLPIYRATNQTITSILIDEIQALFSTSPPVTRVVMSQDM